MFILSHPVCGNCLQQPQEINTVSIYHPCPTCEVLTIHHHQNLFPKHSLNLLQPASPGRMWMDSSKVLSGNNLYSSHRSPDRCHHIHACRQVSSSLNMSFGSITPYPSVLLSTANSWIAPLYKLVISYPGSLLFSENTKAICRGLCQNSHHNYLPIIICYLCICLFSYYYG